MPNVSFTIKYGYKLRKMAIYAIVLYRHGDRIDRPGQACKRNSTIYKHIADVFKHLNDMSIQIYPIDHWNNLFYFNAEITYSCYFNRFNCSMKFVLKNKAKNFKLQVKLRFVSIHFRTSFFFFHIKFICFYRQHYTEIDF